MNAYAAAVLKKRDDGVISDEEMIANETQVLESNYFIRKARERPKVPPSPSFHRTACCLPLLFTHPNKHITTPKTTHGRESQLYLRLVGHLLVTCEIIALLTPVIAIGIQWITALCRTTPPLEVCLIHTHLFHSPPPHRRCNPQPPWQGTLVVFLSVVRVLGDCKRRKKLRGAHAQLHLVKVSVAAATAAMGAAG